ncbi:MAG: tail fiber domain-containing protein, partial [Candidatus Zixiibacteriota bacterium]
SNKVRIGNTEVTSIGGQVGWTTFSDGRYKKSISENVPGLSFISKLRPVTFTIDVDAIDAVLRPPRQPREGESEDDLRPSAEEIASKQAQSQIVYTGFVAQEVEQAAQETGYDFSGVDAPKNDKGMYGLRYAEFVVPLVKAVQEQQQLIQEQQEEIRELKQRIAELEK